MINIWFEVTKEEFLQATQSYAQITPYEVWLFLFSFILFLNCKWMQVEILFHLSELAHPGVKTLSLTDIERIDPERLKR